MIRFNAVDQVATMVRTMDGSPLGWPTVNDSGNEGEVLGENTTAAEQDPAFGQTPLNVVKFSSKSVAMSLELMQDSVFNMSSTLGSLLGTRIGRAKATRFTTGTLGIVTRAGNGPIVTTSETLAYNDMVDLITSVDGAYAQNGSFMFNRDVQGRVMKVKDTDGNPIFQRDSRMGMPDSVLGYPVYTNDKMVDFDGVANTRPIIFGDLSKYHVREAMDIELYILDQHLILDGAIGFVAFARCGGNLIDAGEDPIRALRDKA